MKTDLGMCNMEDFNNLDIAIMIIVALSAVIALSRGLFREILSIIGWFLSAVVVVFLLPFVRPFANAYISNPTAADIAASIVILIVFVVIWVIFSCFVTHKIRGTKLGIWDRGLGFIFGAVRAILLVVLAYIFINWLIPKDNQVDLIAKSKCLNMVAPIAASVEGLIPEEMMKDLKERAKVQSVKSMEQKKKEEAVKSLFEQLSQPKTEADQKMEEVEEDLEEVVEEFEGYKEGQRDDLNRLIDATE